MLIKNNFTNPRSRRVKFTTFECSKTEIIINNTLICFFCVYRPPPSGKNNFSPSMFIDEFELFIDENINLNSKIIIIGDMNLHFDSPHETYVKQMCNSLNIRNLFQLVHEPTHIKGHTLDWLITNDASFISNIYVKDHAISDHFTITCSVNIDKPAVVKKVISSRHLKVINRSDFREDLKKCNIVVGNMSPNIMSHAYDHVLTQLIDRHAPRKSRSVTARRSAPWLTEEIIAAKTERRRAERKFNKHRLPENRVALKLLQCKVNNLIKSAKKVFYEKVINGDITSKSLFRFVSRFYNKESNSILPSFTSASEITERFSKYFIEKIKTIRDTIDACNVSINGFNTTFFTGSTTMSCFKTVANSDVHDCILSSAPKSCLLDPFPTSLLFENIDCIIDSITNIINYSLLSGSVPSSFKHALVSPLLKKNDLDPYVNKPKESISISISIST